MMIVKIISAIISTLLFLIPSFHPEPISDDVLLNVALISDTHIDATLPLGQAMLTEGLRKTATEKAAVDALVVCGDLTNYGDEASLKAFYEIVAKECGNQALIMTTGNHDIGHAEELTNEEARQLCINYYNEYSGNDTQNVYYSTEVKGYTFIVLGDQSEDNWDRPEYFQDQLEFLDSELTAAEGNGKPMFVVCHVPVAGTNGQQIVWEDGCAREEYDLALRAVLESHKNVYFISGHLHSGLNSKITHDAFGVYSLEEINGVTYINLPTYTLVNRYGIPGSGTGMRMEVYEDRIEFRGHNFITGNWYEAYSYTVELNASSAQAYMK